MESSHSLPSVFHPERPRRRTRFPARYGNFILSHGHWTQDPAAAPPYPAEASSARLQHEPRYQSEEEEEPSSDGEQIQHQPQEAEEGEESVQSPQQSDGEEELGDSELPAEDEIPLPPVLTLEGAPAPSHHPQLASAPDPQTALLQQLLEEVRNQGRLIQQCMIRGSTPSSISHSSTSSSLDTHGPQLVASTQAPHTTAPPQASTSSHRPFSLPPLQRQRPSSPPVSRATPAQPLAQSRHASHPPAHSQVPAISHGLVAPHPPYPPTLPYPALPTTMPYSAQPAYQPPSVQSHHPTSAAHSSHLAPPAARLQSYRRVEGPSFPDLTREDESQYMMLKMALFNLLDPNESEQYKYHILLGHLKVDQAKRLALAYIYAPDPYTQAIRALDDRYGQPRQLALRELRAIMDMPAIRAGDGRALDQFSLRVQALVGLLQSMGHEGHSELTCGSHVERLLEKLPSEQFCQFKRSMVHSPLSSLSYNLLDFSNWLQREACCQPRRERAPQPIRPKPPLPSHPFRATTIFHGGKNPPELIPPQAPSSKAQPAPPKASQPSPSTSSARCPVCAYCQSTQHHISKCDGFLQLTNEQKAGWVKEQKRCWRCARDHFATQCDLKGRCNQCNGKHLQVLCDINQRSAQNLYLDHPSDCNKVLLKVVEVTLQNGNRSLDTHAILDDGSERTVLLHPAAQELQLVGEPESLKLRTVRQDVQTLFGATVSFKLIPKAHPGKSYAISNAFTASKLSLSEHTHPVKSLQRRYAHLRQLPLKQLDKVSPLLLIGADHTHLITPTQPVKSGPPGAPAAIKTRLGWTLQGPARDIATNPSTRFHYISFKCPPDDIHHNVQKLWQLEALPQRSMKAVVRSQQDQQALNQLEAQTIRIPVDGVLRYATPLLRVDLGECLSWTSIPSRESSNTPNCFMSHTPGLSTSLVGH